MDRISGLPDELLIKILSFLPTKVAVSTSILSKRWECIWMWLPKLNFVHRYCSMSECKSFRRFLNRNLPLHRAPVIESFVLNLLCSRVKPEEIKLWIVIAISRCIRKLKIDYDGNPKKANILPSSLYICRSLVSLKLSGHIRFIVPRMVCLPSLKTLQLRGNKYIDGKSLGQLLCICPVLEHLLVGIYEKVEIGKITVIVPTLRSLSLYIPYDGYVDGLVIDTPLKYLKLEDYNDKEDHIQELHTWLIEKMPNLEEAYLNVNFPDIECLIRAITSVKRLTLCSVVVYGDGFVFDQLKHLKLCVGTECSSNLLIRLLKDSPNLRVLDLYLMEDRCDGGWVCWDNPRTVPECIVSNLQIFSWSNYYGRPHERDLAVSILKNAHCLETATISPDEHFVPKLEMIKELSLSSRASTTCQLIFS